jgi:anti-sigma B factor antagonist
MAEMSRLGLRKHLRFDTSLKQVSAAAPVVEAGMQDSSRRRDHTQDRALKITQNEPGARVTQLRNPSDGGLEITVDRNGEHAILFLNGRITVDSSPDLRDRLHTILSEAPSLPTVIVDLAGVPYIETSGIATLIEALRIARHHQTSLRLQGLTGAVARLFEFSGVITLFESSGSTQKVS